MAVRRRSEEVESETHRPPATTPQERENQLVSAAVDLADRQIRAGTASSQVIVHYLKLGSSREKLEQERIGHENSLLVTKREIMESEKRTEQLVIAALEAMKAYTGNSTDKEGPEYDEFED